MLLPYLLLQLILVAHLEVLLGIMRSFTTLNMMMMVVHILVIAASCVVLGVRLGVRKLMPWWGVKRGWRAS